MVGPMCPKPDIKPWEVGLLNLEAEWPAKGGGTLQLTFCGG